MEKRKDAEFLEKNLEKLKYIKNAAELPHYQHQNFADYEVKIIIDNKIEPALFKPHPTQKNTWLANEQTYRAMRENIFALDEHMLDLADNIKCVGCSKTVDKQFWKFCPHCGKDYT